MYLTIYPFYLKQFFSWKIKEIKLQDELPLEIENDTNSDNESIDVLNLKSMNITDEEKEILMSKNEGFII